MKKIIRIIPIITLMFLFFGHNFILAQEYPYKSYGLQIRLHSQYLVFPHAQPYIDAIGERSYIPLDYLIEVLGGTCTFSEDGRSAIIHYQNQLIEVAASSDTATVNGQAVEMIRSLSISDGELMVPATFIGQFLNYQVDWDYGTRCIVIFK